MTEGSIWERVDHVGDLPGDRVIHPRVLQADDAGGRALVFASFADVQDARRLFSALRPAVEAAWLAELCGRPTAERARASDEPVTSLELFCFGDLPAESTEAVRAFGFRPAELDDAAAARLPQLRAEASLAQASNVEHAPRLFRAEVRYALDAEALDANALAERLGAEPFGERPGRLAAILGSSLEVDDRDDPLTRLDALERRLFLDAPDVVRGLLPVVMPALSDLVGVALARGLGLEVGWAVSERDPDGFWSPPLLQVGREGEAPILFHVALELLRRCVMPKAEGEAIAPLSAWLRGAFVDG